jgi:hypothetical protein
MNLTEFNALPGTGHNRADAERLFALARQYRDMATRAYSGMSGADRVEAPAHDYTADAFGCIAQGKDVESVIALFDSKWRAYAAEQVERVNAAPKTTRGPYSGQSSAHYKWVSADHFQHKAILIRQIAAQS